MYIVKKYLLRAVIIIITAFFCYPTYSKIKTHEIHIWIKSFIPLQHPNRKGYIIKTSCNNIDNCKKWVIPAPERTSCFSTDNRSFDNNPEASARVTTEFIVKIEGKNMTYDKAYGRDITRIGSTTEVDCITGKIINVKTQSTDTVRIGDVKKGNFWRIFYVKASSSNPFYSMAPNIDFSYSLKYDIINRNVEIVFTHGYFPSFEGYYSVDGGDIIKMFNIGPIGDATAWKLIDLNLGINTNTLTAIIEL